MHRETRVLGQACKAGLLAALIAALIVSFAPIASAQMGIFQNDAMAQMHCPNDEVVWLDFKKRRYYVRGQRLYERGRSAVFVCKKEAKNSGYKRSRLGLR